MSNAKVNRSLAKDLGATLWREDFELDKMGLEHARKSRIERPAPKRDANRGRLRTLDWSRECRPLDTGQRRRLARVEV